MDSQNKKNEELTEKLERLRLENSALKVLATTLSEVSAESDHKEMTWLYALEGNRDGVWDWNAVTNEVFFSKRWKEMLGFEENEISNDLSEWDKRVHPDDKDDVYVRLNHHLDGETPFYQHEHRVQCKDGSYKWILDRGKVISWTEGGKPLRVVGTHTDVTLRKEIELANQRYRSEIEEKNLHLEDAHLKLRKAKDLLVESEKLAALGKLVRGIAHELNTPVGIAITGASYLEDISQKLKIAYEQKTMTKQHMETFLASNEQGTSMVNRSLELVAGLIQQFTDLSVDQGRQVNRIYNLSAHIHSILKYGLPESHQSRYQISMDLDDELMIEGDPDSLKKILVQFVDNSLIHGFENSRKGYIHLKTRKAEDYFEITYRDDGIGIPEDQLKHIFEPFYTLNSASRGLGIGLHAIYNLVVHQMKGTIQCNSQPGKGTEFYIRIPLLQVDGDCLRKDSSHWSK